MDSPEELLLSGALLAMSAFKIYHKKLKKKQKKQEAKILLANHLHVNE